MLFRRFGYIHARILLQKQDELKEIEEQLRSMDERDNSAGPRIKRCLKSRLADEKRTDLQDGKETRGQLLRRAEKIAREYGACFTVLPVHGNL
jgi:hypothetical protein